MSKAAGLLFKLNGLMKDLMVFLRFLDTPLLPGMTRVRWQCVAGNV